MLLRLAHLGRSHHLHRLGNLRGVANRFDPAPYVLSICHYDLGSPMAGLKKLIARQF